jgi:hypothetical protein
MEIITNFILYFLAIKPQKPMKILITILFLAPFYFCNAQLMPCFEPISEEPVKTENDIRPDSLFAVQTLYYPTGLENKMVKDSIFTIDPKTRKESLRVVERSMNLADCDEAEIEIDADIYYYLRMPGKKCFQLYRLEKLVRVDQMK